MFYYILTGIFIIYFIGAIWSFKDHWKWVYGSPITLDFLHHAVAEDFEVDIIVYGTIFSWLALISLYRTKRREKCNANFN